MIAQRIENSSPARGGGMLSMTEGQSLAHCLLHPAPPPPFGRSPSPYRGGISL